MSVLKWDNDCMQDWFSAEDAVELVCHAHKKALHLDLLLSFHRKTNAAMLFYADNLGTVAGN